MFDCAQRLWITQIVLVSMWRDVAPVTNMLHLLINTAFKLLSHRPLTHSLPMVSGPFTGLCLACWSLRCWSLAWRRWSLAWRRWSLAWRIWPLAWRRWPLTSETRVHTLYHSAPKSNVVFRKPTHPCSRTRHQGWFIYLLHHGTVVHISLLVRFITCVYTYE